MRHLSAEIEQAAREIDTVVYKLFDLTLDGIALLDSLAAWLTDHGHSVDRIRSKGGYRVLEVHAATGSPHDGSRAR